MGTPLNWTREETYKLISVWSEGVIRNNWKGAAGTAKCIVKLLTTFTKQVSQGLWNNAETK